MNEAFYPKIAKTRLRCMQDTSVSRVSKFKAEVLQFQLRNSPHDACRAQARGALSLKEKSKRTSQVSLVLLLCTIMAEARETNDAIKLLLLSEQNKESIERIKADAYASGQSTQTVNLLPSGFGGSNPPASTTSESAE